jgi:hypothetical protein
MSEAATENRVGVDASSATLDVCIDTDRKSPRVNDDDAGLARIVTRPRKTR